MLTENVLNINEIQTKTKLSLSWLRQLTRNGRLPGIRQGRRYYYRAGDVNRVLGTDFPVRLDSEELPTSLSDLG